MMKQPIICFDEQSFTNIDLSNSTIEKLHYHFIDMRGAYLKNIRAERIYCPYSNFIDSNCENGIFKNSELSNSKLMYANFKNCDFTGANLVNADVHRADFSNSNLSGANLNVMRIDTASFENCIYDHLTVWPDNFDFEKLTG